LPGDITNGVDAVDARVLVLINDDMALFVELHTGHVEIEILHFGDTANSPEKLVNFQLGSVIVDEFEELVLALSVTDELDLLDTGVLLVDVDTDSLVPLSHGLLDHGVEFPQEGLAADEHVCLDTDGAHDTSQFDGNVSSTDNGHLGREVLHFEESVTCNTVLSALNIRQAGSTSRRNQNMGSCVAGGCAVVESDLDGLGLHEFGPAMNKIDAFLAPVSLIDPIQTLHRGITKFLEVVVVDTDVVREIIAVMTTGLDSFGNGGKVPGHLLGNTTKHVD
jgi:hypothetical protein